MHLSPSRLFRQAILLAFTGLALSCVLLPAHADYTFPTFNMAAVDEYTSLPLADAPADTYTSFALTVDWSALGGLPFSGEAAVALAGGPAPYEGYPLYLNGTFSSNGTNSAESRTLTWQGYLAQAYLGGDNPLHFYGIQTFPGSSANWENIVLTLGKDTPPPPASISVGIPSFTETILEAQEVQWFSFEYITGPLVIDTLGSQLGVSNDTEIGLYNAAGNLIATNDDIDFLGGNFLSQLNIADGSLNPGTFYLALGGFNTTFGSAFNVASTSSITGTAVLNVKSGLPDPPDAISVEIPSITETVLEAQKVQWFSFEYITGSLVIDTMGSQLVSSNDTEIGLFNASGNLLATNDDFDFGGDNLLSRLDIINGALTPGTYYLALGGFNTVFGNNFKADSTSTLTGTAILNINMDVNLLVTAPEPATLSLFAVGGLLVYGFRKRIGR